MTNFWIGIDPSELCNQHLQGLHSELHQEAGTVENHPYGEAVVNGHWKLGQVQMDKLEEKHATVVEEMKRRGIQHSSPLPYKDRTGYRSWILGLPESFIQNMNRVSLSVRCGDCQV